MNDVFQQYKDLLTPQGMNEIETEMIKLNEQTNISDKYDTIFKAFEQAKKINLLVKHTMSIRQKEFTKQYDSIQKDYKKIYFITNLTKEIQDNLGEYCIISRIRDNFGAKLNVVINTTAWGTYMRFPSLMSYTYEKFNPSGCRDARDIRAQLFKIQHIDRIKECVELYKKMITPYIEKMNKFFEEIKTENSKYFVLDKI